MWEIWEPGRVAIYLRVSSEEQKRKETIAAQRHQVLEYCRRHELSVVAEFADDGVEGTNEITERGGGGAMIRAAQRGDFDTLYVFAVDRLGREAYYVLHAEHLLQQARIKLQSVTEPFDPAQVTGKLLLALLAGKAGAEKQSIYERTQAGKAVSLAVDNRYLGGVVPYGYKLVRDRKWKVYVPCDDPLPGHPDWTPRRLIIYIFERAKDGATCQQIGDELHAKGLPTCWVPGDSRYNPPVFCGWYSQRVRVILANPFYAGVQYYGDPKKSPSSRRTEPLKRRVPAIVTWEDFEAAAVTRARSRTLADRNTTRFNLLRGKIRCARCGSNYCGSPSLNYNQPTYVYRCRSAKHPLDGSSNRDRYCGAKLLRAEAIEAIVKKHIEHFLRHPGEFVEELRLRMAGEAQRVHRYLGQADAHEREYHGFQQEELEYYRMRAKGLIQTDDVLEDLLADLRQRAATLKRLAHECRENAKAAALTDQALQDAGSILQELSGRVDEGFLQEEWRELVERFLVEITVHTIGSGHEKVARVEITYRVGATIEAITSDGFATCPAPPVAVPMGS